MSIQECKTPLQLYSTDTSEKQKTKKPQTVTADKKKTQTVINKTVTADNENPHLIPFSASRMNENVNPIRFKDNTSILSYKNKGVCLTAS